MANSKKLSKWARDTLSFQRSIEKAIYEGKGRLADLSCRHANILIDCIILLHEWITYDDPWSQAEMIANVLKEYRDLPDTCDNAIPIRVEKIMTHLGDYGKTK